MSNYRKRLERRGNEGKGYVNKVRCIIKNRLKTTDRDT